MKPTSRKFLLYFVGILAVIAVVILIFALKKPVRCGDAKCSAGEDCCIDCGCGPHEQCNANSLQCESIPECGDGVCERAEQCCEDCSCRPGSRCNRETHQCIQTVSAMCGDQVCSEGENSDSCCEDCACKVGYTCDHNSLMCVRRGNQMICGDGVCDWGEDVNTCCSDCRFCEPGTTCDEELQKCLVEQISLTKEQAIELFQQRLIESGFAPEEIA